MFKKHAQSLIEYTMLLTLIAASIFIMGPYVLRSWNAYLKGWEESIQDSFDDPLHDPNPTPLPLCVCGPWAVNKCGPIGTCSAVQMQHTRLCVPSGCDEEEQCIIDNSCCLYTPGLCGISALHITGERLDGLPGCPDGEREYLITCGALAGYYDCGFYDSILNIFTPSGADPTCNFLCLGAPPGGIPTTPRYKGLCLGDDQFMTVAVNYSTVGDGKCSAPPGSAPKCQVECRCPFIPQLPPPPFIFCDCPVGYVPNAADDFCICPPGWVENENCGPNEVETGACPAGFYEDAIPSFICT